MHTSDLCHPSSCCRRAAEEATACCRYLHWWFIFMVRAHGRHVNNVTFRARKTHNSAATPKVLVTQHMLPCGSPAGPSVRPSAGEVPTTLVSGLRPGSPCTVTYSRVIVTGNRTCNSSHMSHVVRHRHAKQQAHQTVACCRAAPM